MEKCPACSGKGEKVEFKPYVKICKECDAVFSNNIYLGESYDWVLPVMTTENVPPERQRYYDFTCLGSAGITRRHGWYDIETKRIVQVG